MISLSRKLNESLNEVYIDKFKGKSIGKNVDVLRIYKTTTPDKMREYLLSFEVDHEGFEYSKDNLLKTLWDINKNDKVTLFTINRRGTHLWFLKTESEQKEFVKYHKNNYK